MAEQQTTPEDEEPTYEPDENELAAMQTDPLLDEPATVGVAAAPTDAQDAADPAPIETAAAAETPAVAAETAPAAMTPTPAAPPPAKADTPARWRFEFSETDADRLTVRLLCASPNGSASAEEEARRLRREAEQAVRDSEAFKQYQAAAARVNALDRPRREQLVLIADIQGRVDAGCDPNDLAALAQSEIQAKGAVEFAGRALAPAVRERTDAARAVWLEARRIAEQCQMKGMAHVADERRDAGRLLAAVEDALDRLMSADYLCGLMSGMWAYYNGPSIAAGLVGAEPPPPVRPAAQRNAQPPWSDIITGAGLPGSFHELAALGSVPQASALPATAEELARRQAAQAQAAEAVHMMNGGAS